MSNKPRRPRGARNGSEPEAVDIPGITNPADPLGDPPLLATGIAIGGGPYGDGRPALVYQFQLADGTVTRPVAVVPVTSDVDAELDAIARLTVHSVGEAKAVLLAGQAPEVELPTEVTAFGHCQGCGQKIYGDLIAGGFCQGCNR